MASLGAGRTREVLTVRRLVLALLGGGFACSLPACDGDMRAYFARDVVELESDIAYVEGSTNPRQTLDLYRPRGVRDYPVVVFVHGGYWVAQDKRYFAPVVGLYGNVGQALARRGIGVVIMNYRLVPDVTFNEQLGDVIAALRWTAQHVGEYGGDPTRVVLAGHSAGGHMTSLIAFDKARLASAGFDASRIKGFAPLSPIFDLEDMAAHPPESDFNARVTEPVFGADLSSHSPRRYFRGDAPPLFVAMGDADEAYLVPQIPRAVAELKALGATISLLTLPGHSHADVVVNFDTDKDQLAAPLAEFVQRVAR